MDRAVFVVILLLFSLSSFAKEFVISAPSDIKHGSNLEKIVSQSYQRLGYTSNIKLMPAKRAMLSAQYDDNYDAELARIRDAGKTMPNLLRVPVVLAVTQLAVITSKGQGEIQSIDDLADYRVSGIRGVVLTDELLSIYSTIYANDVAHAIDLLNAGRIDLILVPINFTDPLALEYPGVDSEEFSIYLAPVPPQKLYHYVHKRHRALIPRLAEAISEVSGFPVESSAW